MLKERVSSIIKRTLIGTAVVAAAASAGNTAAAETDASTDSFSLNEIIQNYYTTDQQMASEQTEAINNIGLNTIDGTKGFDEENDTLTLSVEEMFGVDDPSYINEASGELVLRVSNPNVVSLDESEKTMTKTLDAADTPSAYDITLYGESQGAAKVYLNQKDGETTTTLGTVEVEVR
ncbi:hypothetical protein [Salibacterium lacus]|uniref:Uncharacterized protein n=1 Tax=Salibacterium lacus TaxID=1898109 RepID=A0ABW5T358_9BACI